MIEQERHKYIQQHISRMPPLSTTVSKLLEICNNPKTSPDDLNQVILLDPVLTGKVIKLINSVYYSLPSKISSLSRAIILLGMNTVTNLAISTTILEKFASSGKFRAFSMDAFWTHSIGVGVTAKTIAAELEVPLRDREAYFVAGLLHDLGKIPLNMSFPDEYARVLEPPTENLEPKKNPSYLRENDILNINHCSVGGMIAEKWQLGHALNDTLSCHHHPDGAKEENRLLANIVALGDVYANDVLFGSTSGKDFDNHETHDLLDRVGISWPALFDYRETILEEIEKAKIFLQISTKG